MKNPDVKTRKTAKTPAASPQARLMHLLDEVSASLLERRDDIMLAGTALVARTNCMFISEPGAAKSLLVETICKAIDGVNYFSWLMGRFTEPKEIFGPIDVAALREGRNRIITTGKLPEAHVAFLDEYWKSSTAIANTLLKITNEKMFNNGESWIKVPLQTLFVCSNEYAQDGELAAMQDRFPLRKELKYCEEAASRRALIASMDHTPKVTERLTLDDLNQAHAEAMALPFSEHVINLAHKIDEALIAAGIHVSDRRRPFVGRVARAYAYLQGANEVRPIDLSILKHLMWSTPGEHIRECARIVEKLANPVGFQVTDGYQKVKSILKSGKSYADVEASIKEVCEEMSVLADSGDERVRLFLEWAERQVSENSQKAVGIKSTEFKFGK